MRARLLVVAVLLCGPELFAEELLEKVVASAGETAVLPCSITLSHDIPTVEWSREGLKPDVVFLYRDGCETYEMKNPIFHQRTSLIMNKVKEGNVSLMISNVQLTDAGKYQCKIISNIQFVKILELVVVAVSEPRLSVVPDVNDGVTLQCETNCWFPAPEMTFLDAQGNSISAENLKRRQNSTGCFLVTGRVTVQSPTNRVTCRVHQPQINKTRDTDIYIPDACMRSYSVPIIIIIIITALVTTLLVGSCAVFILKKCFCECGKTPVQSSDRSAAATVAGGHSTGNATSEHLTKMNELTSKLAEKDVTIRLLTKELDKLRSIKSPVLQHGQPTIDCNPFKSWSGTSKPVNYHLQQFPHNDGPKPANSVNNNRVKSGNSSQSKASKQQNPALDPAVQASGQSHTGAAVSTNNRALSPRSAPASCSEKKHHVRSRSFSDSKLLSAGAKIPRRYTTPVPNHNRFSILAEDSEMLLSHEQK